MTHQELIENISDFIDDLEQHLAEATEKLNRANEDFIWLKKIVNNAKDNIQTNKK